MRNPGLDLVRALAVCGVLIAHHLNIWLTGRAEALSMIAGGLGLTAFFALSGALIGGILLDLAERPSLDAWGRFMARRWGRTIPTFYVVGAILLVLAPPETNVLQHIVRWATFTQNLVSNPQSEWFGVAWSLSIEEIFYLLFASVLLIGVRIIGKKAIWLTISLFIIAPFIARYAMLLNLTPVEVHAGLFHLDQIAYGVAFSAIHRKYGKALIAWWPLALALGLALAVATWRGNLFSYTISPFMLPLQPSMAALACTLLLIPAMRLQSLGFASLPVQFVAKHSFPIYLIHCPLLYALHDQIALGSTMQTLALTVLWLTLTGYLSYLLSRFVEIPCMKLRPGAHSTKPANLNATA